MVITIRIRNISFSTFKKTVWSVEKNASRVVTQYCEHNWMGKVRYKELLVHHKTDCYTRKEMRPKIKIINLNCNKLFNLIIINYVKHTDSWQVFRVHLSAVTIEWRLPLAWCRMQMRWMFRTREPRAARSARCSRVETLWMKRTRIVACLKSSKFELGFDWSARLTNRLQSDMFQLCPGYSH